eukprot:TRINITY_DN6765_c0_g1_i1.p1 TRINITY_DN6765_c0_g1~~TRINITY_DN6765_c0_g1_i1.p1  ORF type:complete len:683 (+),score=150.45 TRINITY_DN6765_c0_g1_i1:184-2232(+)
MSSEMPSDSNGPIPGKKSTCIQDSEKASTEREERDWEEDMKNYPLIEDHAIIGNMKTIAMVSTGGSLNWFCYPHFDSPSIFASLLDHEIGGSFDIHPSEDEHVVRAQQMYTSCNTNVLLTKFSTTHGLAQIVDCMPVHKDTEKRKKMNFVVRQVVCLTGVVKFSFKCKPAFNYARDKATMTLEAPNRILFTSEKEKMRLICSLNFPENSLQKTPEGARDAGAPFVHGEFSVKENEPVTFIFAPDNEHHACDGVCNIAEADQVVEDTRRFWLDWISKCSYKGRWREQIFRSALALKLLTFEETGAIVAAGTTSLPEFVGGKRNFDYRFTWMRDASFTIYAMMRLGYTEEAAAFMKFVEARCDEASHMPKECVDKTGPLQLAYRIDGSREMEEIELNHLDGYKGSRPVRIGNGAYNQLQLDIYGEIMDSVYLYNKYGAPITYDFWTRLRKIINWVCENWKRKDEGMWEVRSAQQHFVYSKVMCWVAVDRGLRLAERRSFPAPRAEWEKVRDEIYEDILTNGWHAEKSFFSMYYGSHTLDASAAIMPLVFFMAPNDPRIISTLEAILKAPKDGGLVKNSLVYRYDVTSVVDGFDGAEEGTFIICSFWLIEALTRVGRHDAKRLLEAHKKFEDLMQYTNHVGLLGEEISVTGRQLGNFPQAFSHIALISCGFNLDRDLDAHRHLCV